MTSPRNNLPSPVSTSNDIQICSKTMVSDKLRSHQDEAHLVKWDVCKANLHLNITMKKHRRKEHRNGAKYVQQYSSNHWPVQKHAARHSINKSTGTSMPNPQAEKTPTPSKWKLKPLAYCNIKYTVKGLRGSLRGTRWHKNSLEGPKLA